MRLILQAIKHSSGGVATLKDIRQTLGRWLTTGPPSDMRIQPMINRLLRRGLIYRDSRKSGGGVHRYALTREALQ